MTINLIDLECEKREEGAADIHLLNDTKIYKEMA
jgi:hypothetical protein